MPMGRRCPMFFWSADDAGRVVFLCGAGVSRNSDVLDFVGHAKSVIESFDPLEDSEILAAFRPWRENLSGCKLPLDQIFNLLHQEYGRA